MNRVPTVFVVDDDNEARDSVCALVRSMNLEVRSYSSAEEFLQDTSAEDRGCLVVDVRMTGMSGIELVKRLHKAGVPLPAVVLTAHARTPLTVEAMVHGAVSVLDKPYEAEDLWDAIRKALSLDAKRTEERRICEEIRRRAEQLTRGERQVMDRVVMGKANKVIAQELDVSERTVENRRRKVFDKMQAESVAELVRFVISADLDVANDDAPPESGN